MIELIQNEDFSFGSPELVKRLAEKESARILVISDSHGSKNNIQDILLAFGKDCDALCFCGDGIPDLCWVIERCYRMDFVPPILFFVQGNGDNSTGMILAERRLSLFVPVETEFFVCGKKFYMTHGHRYNVYFGTKDIKKVAAEKNAHAVFYGHTHVANAQDKKILLLNPGSCALPRGGLPHTFAMVDVKKNAEKLKYKYFEIKWNADGEINFEPYTPPKGEIKLFW